MKKKRKYLFKRHHNKISAIFLPICTKSIQKCHLNVLRIMNTIYHIYIASGFYKFTFTDFKNNIIRLVY